MLLLMRRYFSCCALLILIMELFTCSAPLVPMKFRNAIARSCGAVSVESVVNRHISNIMKLTHLSTDIQYATTPIHLWIHLADSCLKRRFYRRTTVSRRILDLNVAFKQMAREKSVLFCSRNEFKNKSYSRLTQTHDTQPLNPKTITRYVRLKSLPSEPLRPTTHGNIHTQLEPLPKLHAPLLCLFKAILSKKTSCTM